MKNGMFRFHPQELKRPEGSKRLIREAFSRFKCVDCGVCCMEKPTHLTHIPPQDPNKEELLRAAAESFPWRITPAPAEGFNIQGDDACAFLERGQERLCSVYSIRPMVCRVFPFMLLRMKAKTTDGEFMEKPFVVLTSSCPPLAEIRRRGILHMEPDDFMGRRKRKGRSLPAIPLLKRSFLILEDYMEKGILDSEQSFLEVDGKRIIPVG